MKEHNVISKATIGRLPLYLRTLCQLQEEHIEIISSEELGKKIGVTPEQIRKDLASFGEFGKKGVGYFVTDLIKNIMDILGLHQNWNLAIIGSGHLGWALANYKNFRKLGFILKAVFDVDPAKIGEEVAGIKVQHIDELPGVVKERNIEIGVITVPASGAQEVADRLIAAGVRGIWNFAPTKINVPEEVCLINEDLSVGLSNLSFHLSRGMI